MSNSGILPEIPVRPAWTALVATIVLTAILYQVAAAATRVAPASNTVVVEASGDVPGFTATELTGYLAGRLHEYAPAPWQFSAAQPGMGPAPNRVVWVFKTLRKDWKGGSHRGFPSPTNSVFYLSAEVKLYLSGTYQTTMMMQPSVSGGPDDEALARMVNDVAHTLFVENKPDGS